MYLFKFTKLKVGIISYCGILFIKTLNWICVEWYDLERKKSWTVWSLNVTVLKRDVFEWKYLEPCYYLCV